jgi:hypothetical protein
MEESNKVESSSAKWWGIGSFVASFLFPLLALGSGIISLVKGKDNKDRTHFGFALAGIVVASLNMLFRFFLVFLILVPLLTPMTSAAKHDKESWHMSDGNGMYSDDDMNWDVPKDESPALQLNENCDNLNISNEFKDMGWDTDVFRVACEVIGLNELEAVDYIESEGYYSRIAARDDESFALTMDYRSDRINLFVKEGKVSDATVG